jgi:hypothetical protein
MGTIGAGLRTVIVGTGLLDDRVYRDKAPSDASHPYAVFHDYLADTSVLRGDGRTLARRRIAQVDVFFASRADEDHDLIEDLKTALDGVAITGAPGTTMRVREPNVFRAWWHDADDVRYVFDLRADYLV